MKALLEKILDSCRCEIEKGKVASYIPELAKADVRDFGISIMDPAGNVYSAGDYDKPFTMQSIIKPITLLAALIDNGEDRVRDLVGVEATGKPFDAFNYSDLALSSEHINPMINTGAIALCTMIGGATYGEKFERLLSLVKAISGNPDLQVDEQVYHSEKSTGNKNRALAYMLKAYGLITADVEELLDLYFRACSIRVNTLDLARIGLVFASHGKDPVTGQRHFSARYARYVNAILMTCGMYDGSGEFALNVGIPAKSGVGGGIVAIAPNKMGIGIYSPALNGKGNSIAGIKALEQLSAELELSIF